MFRFKFKKQKQTKARKEYEERHAGSFSKTLTSVFFICLLLFIFFFSFYIYFIKTYFISDVFDVSMQPTLNANITSKDSSQDFVYVNKRATIKHGDIVTIKHGANSIIKRVIAVEGDKISIVFGDDGLYHIYIINNNERDPVILEEGYVKNPYDWSHCTKFGTPIADGTYSYEAYFYKTFIKNVNYFENVENIDEMYYVVVPEGSCLCLGDNRVMSRDSREEGFYSVNTISGVAEIIVKNGNLDDGDWLLGKKLSAILGYYWRKIAHSFAR